MSDEMLTERQVQLRDGVGTKSGHAAEKRRERVARLEREIAEAQAFVEDLDRYATHASQAPLVGSAVGPYMARRIKNIRDGIVRATQELQRERALKQEAT